MVLYAFCPHSEQFVVNMMVFLVLRPASTKRLSEVSEGTCTCIFKVTKLFMWMTGQCSIETS